MRIGRRLIALGGFVVRSVNEKSTVESLDHVAAGSPDPGSDHTLFTSDAPPMRPFNAFAKRAFDIVAAAIGLFVFSPMFLLASLAIRLNSRGPVFSAQVWHDCDNEQIRVFKFRTTTGEICDKFVQAGRRSYSPTTHVGRILRRTGIEGLPQLINVLRGEMSIVGPHPYITVPGKIFNEQNSRMAPRHDVKPGITGWAQVNGCSGTRQRTEFDLHYIENWSFLFDLKIILMTLFSKNAYLN